MNELQQFLIALLGATLKWTPEQVSALFDAEGKILPTAAQALIQADASKVAALLQDTQQKIDAAVAKAKSDLKGQELGIYERKLKAKVGVQSEKQGEELMDEIIAKLRTNEVTEAQVQAHPAYVRMEDKYKADLAAKEAEKTQAVETVKASITAQEAERGVMQMALVKLEKLRPVLPSNAEAAAEQRRLFTQKLKEGGINFRIDNPGTAEERVIVLNAQHERLKDANGNNIEIDDHVRQVAGRMFDFKAGDDRDAPPDPGTGGGGGSGGAGSGQPSYDLGKTLVSLGQKLPGSRSEWSKVFAFVETTTKLNEAERGKAMVALSAYLKEKLPG